MNEPQVDFSLSQSVLDEDQKVTIARAIDLYESGDYKASLNMLLSLVQKVQNALAFTCIGNCYKKMGDLDNAKAFLEKAIERPSMSSLPYISLGNLHYEKGNIQQAILHWTIANTLIADDENLLLNLASAYAKKELRIQSISYYEKYIRYATQKASPTYQEVYSKITKLRAIASKSNNIAARYYKSKAFEKSIESYYSSVLNYPLQPQVNHMLGNMFFLTKDYKSAIECWLNAYISSDFNANHLGYIPIAYEKMNMLSYAYCFYYILMTNPVKKVLTDDDIKAKLLQHSIVVFRDQDYSELHYNSGKKFELENNYLMAYLEYSNALILSKKDKKKMEAAKSKMYDFITPEMRVVSTLQFQVTKHLKENEPELAILVCDKILSLIKPHSPVESIVKRKKEECIRLLDSLKR